MVLLAAPLLLLLNTQILPVSAQLPLPSPAYNPPDKSAGYASDGSTSSSQQWSNLLGNLIWMYEAQRSGQLPSNNRVSWRNSTLADDGRDSKMDLSGGYYDAGDYIKATYPLAFSLFSACWGANVFGAGYDTANQTPYLDGMLRWGLDWLIKAHPTPNSLVVQLADTKFDNNYWGGDLNIPTPRPAFVINNDAPGTDIAALTSAAFSSCSALYAGFPLSPSSKPASLQNSSYAATLLTHATQLHDFANTWPFKLYSESFDKSTDFAYPGSAYQDKLVLAEVLLGVATAASSTGSGTSPQTYIDRAIELYDDFKLQVSNQDVVLNWASMTPAIPVLLSLISSSNNATMQPQGGLAKWQQESEMYFDRILNGKGRGRMTSGGLLWYEGDSDLASLNPAMNLAMLMMVYGAGEGTASSQSKRNDYLAYAQRQVDYALGKNPMNVPYIVGSNPNSPSNPHDAKSHGGSDIENIDINPKDSAHVLYGAAVGGPDRRDRFWDIRTDWPQTEIALDYNAPFFSIVAYSIMAHPDEPPFYTTLPPGAYEKVKPSGTPCDAVFPCTESGSGGLSKAGKIAVGVVVGVVGLLVLFLAGCFIVVMRKRKAKAHAKA